MRASSIVYQLKLVNIFKEMPPTKMNAHMVGFEAAVPQIAHQIFTLINIPAEPQKTLYTPPEPF